MKRRVERGEESQRKKSIIFREKSKTKLLELNGTQQDQVKKKKRAA